MNAWNDLRRTQHNTQSKIAYKINYVFYTFILKDQAQSAAFWYIN